MTREILEDSFKAARDRYAGAVRTSFVIVAVLLAFHMTTLSQYIQREQALRVAKDEKDKASLLQEITKRMVNSAKSLDEERESRTKWLINNFVEGLISDFVALDGSIRQVSGRDDGRNIRSNPNLPSTGQFQQQQQQQQQQIQQQIQVEQPRVVVIPTELVEKLKSISDTDRLRIEFAPWITATFVTPRVDQLRAGWKTSVWPQLRSYVLALAGEMSQAEELLLKDSTLMARLAQLSKQIEDLLKKGESLDFAVPESSTWWQTIGGKITTGMAIGEESAHALSIDVVGESVRVCERAVIDAKQKADLIFAEQESARNALEKGFEEQKKRAEELAKPLTYLALDLALITESFPLILAVGIGVAIFWPGWRRREALETWGALITVDPEWRNASATLGIMAQDSLALILGLVAALTWIAVTGWQLTTSQMVSAQRAQAMCTQGAVIVVVAVAWRFYEKHRMARLIHWRF